MGFDWDRGWRCVAGGVCVHLVLGSLYCWGNITMGKSSVCSVSVKQQMNYCIICSGYEFHPYAPPRNHIQCNVVGVC